MEKHITTNRQSYDPVTGRFVKGITPWNLNRHGYMGANRTSFTSEQLLHKAEKSIGVQRICRRGDWAVCLTDEKVVRKDPNSDRMYSFRKRMGAARYNLRKAGIEIPPHHVAWHIDGDPANNDVSNIEIISRAELCRRNSKRRL